jgi:single-strand DNA-binding protein
MNQLTIIGFIGRDAETKSTQKGTQITRFSLATKETWKGNDGDRKEATTWHNIVAYGDGFAKLSAYLNKGAQVLVQGRSNCPPERKN